VRLSEENKNDDELSETERGMRMRERYIWSQFSRCTFFFIWIFVLFQLYDLEYKMNEVESEGNEKLKELKICDSQCAFGINIVDRY
jgi:hypothetical protein